MHAIVSGIVFSKEAATLHIVGVSFSLTTPLSLS